MAAAACPTVQLSFVLQSKHGRKRDTKGAEESGALSPSAPCSKAGLPHRSVVLCHLSSSRGDQDEVGKGQACQLDLKGSRAAFCRGIRWKGFSVRRPVRGFPPLQLSCTAYALLKGAGKG